MAVEHILAVMGTGADIVAGVVAALEMVVGAGETLGLGLMAGAGAGDLGGTIHGHLSHRGHVAFGADTGMVHILHSQAM